MTSHRALVAALLATTATAWAKPPAPAPAAHTPEAAVAALWRAFSREPGQRPDLSSLRELFHPEAIVFGSRQREGEPSLVRTELEAFLAAIDRAGPEGFFECETTRRVEAVDRFATVYSVVESRRRRDAPRADFTGINSLQLHFDGERWRILALYYHVPAADVAVPLGAGASGTCLP